MWAGVIAELQAAGIDAVALANPLRGLASDARYVASGAAEIDGPVLLAGHCYGGAVITTAGSIAGNVTSLVYVAAFAPEDGESALDVIERYPGSLLRAALRPTTLPDAFGDPAVELRISAQAFPQVYAADMPYRQAAVAAAAQRPITAAAFEEKSRAAAWKTTPAWYVVATADHVIPPAAQRFMAQRAGARTNEISASHAIATTQPTSVAGHIAAAASSQPTPWPGKRSRPASPPDHGDSPQHAQPHPS
jgi:pimeloyl-ACP methyl ester carboxylesterase